MCAVFEEVFELESAVGDSSTLDSLSVCYLGGSAVHLFGLGIAVQTAQGRGVAVHGFGHGGVGVTQRLNTDRQSPLINLLGLPVSLAENIYEDQDYLGPFPVPNSLGRAPFHRGQLRARTKVPLFLFRG